MQQDAEDTPWTRSRVEAGLIAAFRAMPGLPVYTVGSRFRTLDGADDSSTAALSWAGYLGRDEDGRKYLWAWARCQATRSSFSELVDGNGWKRATVEAGRRRAAEAIADHLRSVTSRSLDSGKTGIGDLESVAGDAVLDLN